MNKLVPALGLGLLCAAALSAAFEVGESQAAVVSRFGNLRVVREPGLHFKWPAPIDTLWRVDQRIRLLELDSAEYLTSDKQNVLARCALAWSIADPLRFLQSAADPARVEARLKDLVHTQVGNAFGARALGELVSTSPETPGLAAVDREVEARTAEEALETYGVAIEMARITRLSFPAQNRKAVFRRMEAERQKIAQEIRSQGVERAERIRADAELEAAKLISEAKRKAAELRGAGAAEAARIANEAYQQDPALYELMRTLEASDAIFGPDDTIVLPSDFSFLRLLADPSAGEGAAGPRAGRAEPEERPQ